MVSGPIDSFPTALRSLRLAVRWSARASTVLLQLISERVVPCRRRFGGRDGGVGRHVVDLGPTLLAGGTGSEGPYANSSQRKDGVNQWGALSLAPGANHTEPRTEVLLNLCVSVLCKKTTSARVYHSLCPRVKFTPVITTLGSSCVEFGAVITTSSSV